MSNVDYTERILRNKRMKRIKIRKYMEKTHGIRKEYNMDVIHLCTERKG